MEKVLYGLTGYCQSITALKGTYVNRAANSKENGRSFGLWFAPISCLACACGTKFTFGSGLV